jgi:hypothetical protein
LMSGLSLAKTSASICGIICESSIPLSPKGGFFYFL